MASPAPAAPPRALPRRPAPRWIARAACRDVAPSIFFPRKGQSVSRALRVCESCEVREECLDYALSFPAHQDAGVFGGTTVRQRREIRRERAE